MKQKDLASENRRGIEPCPRIKPDLAPLVKAAVWACAFASAFSLGTAWAQPTVPASDHLSNFDTKDTDTFPPPVLDSSLLEIEARKFDVKVVRRSRSRRAYLFHDVEAAKPEVGAILLLKKDKESILAFRVIHTDISKKIFVAKRVRRYGDHFGLEEGDTLTAWEKISEIQPPPPPLNPDDQAETNDLVPLPPPDPSDQNDLPPTLPEAGANSELDDLNALDKAKPENAGVKDAKPDTEELPTPEKEEKPEPAEKTAQADDDEDSGADRRIAASVEDVESLDPSRHWLSAQFGLFKSVTALGSTAFYQGGGLRYGITLGKEVFLTSSTVQDSIALEGGVFVYKIMGFSSQDAVDAYTVMPLIGTLRYNILLNESFGIFLYGGYLQNRIIQTSEPNPDAVALLQSHGPIGGAGMIFRLGPNWEARADFGIDMIGAGLMLRF